MEDIDEKSQKKGLPMLGRPLIIFVYFKHSSLGLADFSPSYSTATKVFGESKQNVPCFNIYFFDQK